MGSLTVHVVNEDQNPVARERVYCNFVRNELNLLDTHDESYTDEDGVAEFEAGQRLQVARAACQQVGLPKRVCVALQQLQVLYPAPELTPSPL